jgi:hypothetical protein
MEIVKSCGISTMFVVHLSIWMEQNSRTFDDFSLLRKYFGMELFSVHSLWTQALGGSWRSLIHGCASGLACSSAFNS